MEPKKNIGRSRQFFSTVCKLHFTCPGLHFGKKDFFEKKTIFHNEFQTSRKLFWQGSQNWLLCVHGISWEKRIVLKRLYCSFFRTFSVAFLDLRQTIWQVVRTAKNLSRVNFEEKVFGDIAQYSYISTWIFNKKLHFSLYFLKWLS